MSAIEVGGTGPSGLRWPNYVNGRLLTSQDLRATHDAVFARDRWLGEAIGPGVVAGLVVGGATGGTSLSVSAGLGINHEGTALRLQAPATLDLMKVEKGTAPTGTRFAKCTPADAITKAPGVGAYLLAVCPQTWFEGTAPVQGPVTATSAAPCVSRWETEGVVFKAIPLGDFTEETSKVNRRNRLAHWCFGSGSLRALAMGGFQSKDPYRGIDKLAPSELGPCDLPLAVFDWGGDALSFVDVWSARRRPVRPGGLVELPFLLGDERVADAEARLLQFQDQLTELVRSATAHTVVAREVFPLLPPAGIMPVSWPAALNLLRTMAGSEQEGIAITPIGRRNAATVAQAIGGTGEPARAASGPVEGLVGIELQRYQEAPGSVGYLATILSKLQEEIVSLRAEIRDLSATVAAGNGGENGEEDRDSTTDAAVRDVLRLMNLALVMDTPADGVDLETFCRGINVRFGVVDPETVDFTIRRSWLDEAIGAADGLDVFFVLDERDKQQPRLAPFVLFAKRPPAARWLPAPGSTRDR